MRWKSASLGGRWDPKIEISRNLSGLKPHGARQLERCVRGSVRPEWVDYPRRSLTACRARCLSGCCPWCWQLCMRGTAAADARSRHKRLRVFARWRAAASGVGADFVGKMNALTRNLYVIIWHKCPIIAHMLHVWSPCLHLRDTDRWDSFKMNALALLLWRTMIFESQIA